MSKFIIPQALRELRFHLSQSGEASAPLKKFLTANYEPLKTQTNQKIPILIREAYGIPPTVYARFEKGRELKENLDGLDEKDHIVSEELQAFAQIVAGVETVGRGQRHADERNIQVVSIKCNFERDPSSMVKTSIDNFGAEAVRDELLPNEVHNRGLGFGLELATIQHLGKSIKVINQFVLVTQKDALVRGDFYQIIARRLPMRRNHDDVVGTSAADQFSDIS